MVGLGCTITTGGAGALACGALGGAIAGGLTSALKGGSVGDVLKATLIGGVVGGLSGGTGSIAGSAGRAMLQKVGASSLQHGVKPAGVALRAATGGVKDIASTFTRGGWRNMAANARLSPGIPATILQSPGLIFNRSNMVGAAAGGLSTGGVAGLLTGVFDVPGAAGGFVGGLFG